MGSETSVIPVGGSCMYITAWPGKFYMPPCTVCPRAHITFSIPNFGINVNFKLVTTFTVKSNPVSQFRSISFIKTFVFFSFFSTAWWLYAAALPQWHLSGSGVLSGWAKGRAGGLSAGRHRVRQIHWFIYTLWNSQTFTPSLFTVKKISNRLRQSDESLCPFAPTHHKSSDFLHSYKMGRITSCWIWISWKQKSSRKVWSALESGTDVPCLPQPQLVSHCVFTIIDILCDTVSQFTNLSTPEETARSLCNSTVTEYFQSLKSPSSSAGVSLWVNKRNGKRLLLRLRISPSKYSRGGKQPRSRHTLSCDQFSL